MEKLNAIYTDPNQHSSRKTKYQHQTFIKKRWISTMERTAQLIINKKRNQFTPQEEKIQTQTIIKTDSECQFVFNKLWPD